MNNAIVWWIVGAIVVVGGGYGVYSSGMLGSGMSSGSESASSTASGQTQSSGTLKDLVAGGRSLECQVSDPSNGWAGTVFVGGGKMHGDFTATSQGKTITSHMISDGQNVYLWSSAMPQGIKMAVSATSASSTSSNSQNMYDQNVNYTCSAWSVDSSEFALPAGVKFQDMSAMLQGSAGAGASGSASECGMCDQISSAAAKAQCKAALHC